MTVINETYAAPQNPGYTPQEVEEWVVPESRREEAANTDDIIDAVEVLFPTDSVVRYTEELLDETDFYQKCEGRRWAVMVLAGTDPRSDIAKRVEVERFSTYFGTHPLKHVIDYGPYDASSIFVTVVDTQHPDGPKPASALRIVKNSEKGFKTINSLASPDEAENPWANDIKAVVGEFGYEDRDRIKSVIEKAMHMVPGTTWAIESMAALEEYAKRHGVFGGPSFPLYAVCLQLSNRAEISTWISIQDLKPLMQMQELFSDPWEWLEVPPRSYDGPLPTLPAFIPDMQQAQERLREANPDMGRLLIDGVGMEIEYVMPEVLFSEEYLRKISSST